MKTVKFLFAFLVISACLINIQAATNINNAPFFQEKFTKDRVWDAQRSPAYPIAGRNWTISGLKAALEANGSAINWGTGRYLRFVAEADIFKSANSLLDDISNSYKYNVVLKLYENNGTLVKIVSRWGRIIGIGDKGFIYEAEGRYGSFFSASDLNASAVVTYKPGITKVSKLSELVNTSDLSKGTEIKVAETPKNISSTAFFNTKFTKGKVWDAQRSPAYPVVGQDWTISGLKIALEANGSAINWGTERYLMFVAEADNAKTAISLVDDINNNGTKYKISLKLFESNGTLVKVVSGWGKIIGIGDKGFMYEAEGRYGSFFSMSDQTASAVTTYKPSLANTTKLSEIAKLTTNTIVVKQDPVTTQTTPETAPVQKCNFKVIYNNTDMLFQEVSGLDSEAQQIEYKQGNSPALSVVKMPGITKMGNVILKKGIFKTTGQKSDCYELLSKSNTSKSTIVICLMDENGSVSMKWSLKNAWINKMTGIGNSPDDLTVESIEIAHEGITMESK